MAATLDKAETVRSPLRPLPPIGTRIDFGDSGVGKIVATNGREFLLRSPVINGWVRWDELAPLLTPAED